MLPRMVFGRDTGVETSKYLASCFNSYSIIAPWPAVLIWCIEQARRAESELL